MDTITVLQSRDDNYMYIVRSGRNALVIDPSEATPVLEYLASNDLTLAMILNTHHHFDHVGGNHVLKKKTGAVVLAYDKTRVPDCDRIIRDEDEFSFSEWNITVLLTAGHTPDSVSFYCKNINTGQKCLFSGDTLFRGGCGRILGTSAVTLWRSLERLADLPGETLVYPGHNYAIENYAFAQSVDPHEPKYPNMLTLLRSAYERGEALVPSTMAEETVMNIFLQSSAPRLRAVLKMPTATDAEIFAELRIRKNSF
jgi:hydroxyacylglutathione hydrolase